MLVVQSGGLRMKIGVLYLSHAMLVLAELIVCSALLHMEVPRPHITNEPTHTLEHEVLA